MAQLTGQKIKDTYDGLLKTQDSTQGIPSTGQALVEDGLGNDSALSIGQANNGITVTGTITGDVTGNLTGDVTGDLTGNVTGDVTGDLTGNSVGTHKGNVQTDLIVDAGANAITIDSLTKTSKNVLINSPGMLGIGTSAPDRPLHVVGNAKIEGNLLMKKTTSKLGIRLNDPQHPLDMNGRARISNISVGTRTSLNDSTRKIHTGQLGSVFNNQSFVQLSDYGQGNLGNINADEGSFIQQTTASFGIGGRLMEDWSYKWFRVKPSWWGVEGDSGLEPQGLYKKYDLFTTSEQNEFIIVDEILVIDSKDPFSTQNRRGNFTGSDQDPWISFRTDSGQLPDARQLAQIELGTYRNEIKKWAYLMRSRQEVQPNNNYATSVQRVRPVISFLGRVLNANPIRPNYNLEFRVKYKKFRLIDQTGYSPTTLQ